MSGPFRHRMRVRWAECDQQGIVFYANYLAYFDIAMTELYREAMGSYQAMLDLDVDMVVAEAGVRYRASARFDDEIDLVASLTRLGTTSTTTALTIERATDGTPLVEGELRHVFVDPKTMGSCDMPAVVRQALEPYALEQT
jgi:acyl-CoA thioester hydrolase